MEIVEPTEIAAYFTLSIKQWRFL